MKKNIIVLLSLLLMVFSLSSVALADQPPVTLDAAIAGANAELQQLFGVTDYFTNTNSNGKTINPDRWLEKNRVLFAYGDPYGDTKITDEGIRYRYIGETVNGEDFTNPQFPHDAWNGGYIEDRTWYQYPWNDDTITKKYGIWPNDFDGNDIYLASIQAGLKMFYGDVLQGESSTYWNNWQEYIHILQPPTKYAWGLGRMWHQEPGDSMYYITIPLVPLADVQQIDVQTVSIDSGVPQGTKAIPGQKYTGKAKFNVLKMETPGQYHVPLSIYHQPGSQGTYYQATISNLQLNTFTAKDGTQFTSYGWVVSKEGDTIEVSFDWTAPSAIKTKLVAVVNKNYPGVEDQVSPENARLFNIIPETDLENNKAWTELDVRYVDLILQGAPGSVSGEPGTTKNITFQVCNNSNETVTSNVAYCRADEKYDWQVIAEQETYSPFETKSYTISVSVEQNSYSIYLETNYKQDSPSDEITFENNDGLTHINTIDLQTDVAISLWSPQYTYETGDDIPLFAKIRRANDGPGKAVPVNITLTGTGVNKNWSSSLSPGGNGSKDTFVIINTPGTYTFTGRINITDDTRDYDLSNNTAACRITVTQAPIVIPPSDVTHKVRLIN